jgi:hypothetical protein
MAIRKKFPDADAEKFNKKVEELRMKEVKKMVFDKYLIMGENARNGNADIRKLFNPLKK